MQRTRASLFVVGINKAKIYTFTHKFSDQSIIALVSTDTVPTKTNNTFEVSLAYELKHLLKLRSINPILDQTIISDAYIVIFGKARVLFGNNTIGGETFDGNLSY